MYKQKYIQEKIETWIDEIKVLANIAKSEPHCALAAFMHGLRNRYVYFMRTILDIGKYLTSLENSIRNHLLPAILEGHQCNDEERELIALSPKFGGLGIINPVKICQTNSIT